MSTGNDTSSILLCTEYQNAAWLISHGWNEQLVAMRVLQWMAFGLCIFCLGFYAYHAWKATTGWEVRLPGWGLQLIPLDATAGA